MINLHYRIKSDRAMLIIIKNNTIIKKMMIMM